MTTAIEWTDATWNPVVGCAPVSPGCLNCYAARMAMRLEAMKRPEYAPRDGVRIAEVRGGRPVFTGDVRCVPERLTDPLRWKKPRMIFVNSMSDLFHGSVPFEFIDRVFAVMALCPQHAFQVLTKRPERMAEYLSSFENDTVVDGSSGMMRLGTAAGKMLDGTWIWGDGKRFRKSIEHFISDTHGEDDEDAGYHAQEVAWPLPNVWVGASAEDQPRADERIMHLLKCPGAVRFLSIEPMLGPVGLSRAMPKPLYHCSECGEEKRKPYCDKCGTQDNTASNSIRGIDWVIVGGESGPGARPLNVDWIRSIVRQCKAAGVPCFVKQLGRIPVDTGMARWPREAGPRYCDQVKLIDPKGGDPEEWPEDLRVREFPVVPADRGKRLG